MFNVLNMANLDTDANDRPVYPPKIISANVAINPFEDIMPRSL
jgi:peptidyl-prolyl cis-trans isomerase SDCCAG10